MKAKSILAQWPELDLVLFTIGVESPEDKSSLEGVGSNFAFYSDVKENMLLTIAGYSPIENPKGFLQITQDSDCRVLSKTNEFRLLNDPDSLQPDNEKKWAFSMGCDAARGDSGGPVMNRLTGAVVGLVWTGTYPVDPKLQNSEVITELLNYMPDLAWTQFDYAVPAPKLLDGIKATIEDSKTNSDVKKILSALIAH